MSVFTLDQILQTDRYVIEEMFELQMSEPELSRELQGLAHNAHDDAQAYSSCLSTLQFQ
jgi:hypothetical protein